MLLLYDVQLIKTISRPRLQFHGQRWLQASRATATSQRGLSAVCERRQIVKLTSYRINRHNAIAIYWYVHTQYDIRGRAIKTGQKNRTHCQTMNCRPIHRHTHTQGVAYYLIWLIELIDLGGFTYLLVALWEAAANALVEGRHFFKFFHLISLGKCFVEIWKILWRVFLTLFSNL